ncbi:MAG: hypothetical protein EA407_00405 [Rhodobacteraceae bacterium]|nr:MAG: hypothetical protein EA407_00405 [Paracoccaceae bacterium]
MGVGEGEFVGLGIVVQFFAQVLLGQHGGGFHDLPGLFGDSLPDGWGRLLCGTERSFTLACQPVKPQA